MTNYVFRIKQGPCIIVTSSHWPRADDGTSNQCRQIRFMQTVVFVDFMVKEFAVTWLLPSNAAELEHVPMSLPQNPDTALLPRVRVFWDMTPNIFGKKAVRF